MALTPTQQATVNISWNKLLKRVGLRPDPTLLLGDMLVAASPSSGVLVSDVVPTAGADIAFEFDTANTFAATDKLLSFQNNTSEVASLTCAGLLTSTSFAGLFIGNVEATASSTLTLTGKEVDGVAAIASKINSPAYTTAGSKLLSVQNNSVEKAYINKDGTIDSKAGITLTSITPPTALTCALAGLGAGLLTNGVYFYRVTFVTAYGETDQGTASASVTVVDNATNGQVAITNIPVSADSRVTGRKLYRCSVGGGSFATKLLTTINDNVTTVYTDNIADVGLGVAAPIINTTASLTGVSYLTITNVTPYDNAIVVPGNAILKLGGASLSGQPSSNTIDVGNITVAATLTANAITGSSTTTTTFTSSTAVTAGTDTAFTFNTTNAITSSDRIASFKVQSTEKAWVTADGQVYGLVAIRSPSFMPSTGTSVQVQGIFTDGPTAVACKINNNSDLNTSGAKIASFGSGPLLVQERSFITKDGQYNGQVNATGILSLTELPAPTPGTHTSAATGGTLLAGTAYYYRVSSTNAAGESLAFAEQTITTPGTFGVSPNTCTTTVVWTAAVPGATGYKVYGRTTGAEELMVGGTITNGHTLSWTDTTLANAPSGALPVGNSTSRISLAYTDLSGTPGDQTIHKLSGKAAIDTLASACTITNVNVTANSIVMVTPLDNDATLVTYKAVPTAGSFTVTGNAAATAPWKFSWFVING